MKAMNRLLLTVLILLLGHYGSLTVDAKPHIILIVADDLGWGDVSYHGSRQIPTPNLDLLAITGVQLDNYYVSPICSPSRSALLTGRHPIQTGMQHNPLMTSQPEGLPLEYRLLPDYLRTDLNYTAHAVGKWHLGFFSPGHLPEARGFESHLGYWSGMIDYYDHTALGNGGKFWGVDWHNGSTPMVPDGTYSTEFFFDQARRQILQYVAKHGARNDTNPLFLYLAPNAVHGANPYAVLQVPPRYLARFKHIKDTKRRHFAGILAALDDGIGELAELLAQVGMLDNTLIVFTSDNGAAACGSNGECIDQSIGSSAPLRGCKYTLWEGGVKVPAFIWGLDPVMPIGQPYRYTNLMHVTDLFATLYTAAGGKYQQRFFSEFDTMYGVDHWQHILNNVTSQTCSADQDVNCSQDQDTHPRQELLHNIDDFNSPDGHFWAIRSGSWKLLNETYGDGNFDNWYHPPGYGDDSDQVSDEEYRKRLRDTPLWEILEEHGRHVTIEDLEPNVEISCGPVTSEAVEADPCNPLKEMCLFNIEEDPCELRNVAADHPDVVTSLVARIEELRKHARSPINQPPDQRSNPALHGGYWSTYL